MPTLFVFLFKVNVALLLFCAGYYLVLRHLTFYSLNRVYLITAIIFASIYPKIDLTAFAQRHENIAVPVQSVILNWQVPAAKLVKPLAGPNYWQWATGVFWAGAALLAVRLLVQLFSLLKLHRKSISANILNHQVRLISGEAAPFSFWRSIYVNPANHTPADLKAILLHEQVHVNGLHTIDILLAELSSIFYWFNPGVWLMKRAVRENIEFITDRKILNNGIDTKTYQYSLVNVSFNNTTPGIVNHFNISTIKKRIIMMNAKRSSRVNLTRYAFVVPAVALLLVFSFSQAAVVKKNSVKAYKAISSTITENLKDVLPASLTLKTDDAEKANATADDNIKIIYYINGVKASKDDAAFSNDTESIYYLNSKDAKKYFNAGDGKHKVGFATMRNSATGLVVKEKIVRLMAEGKVKASQLNNIVISNKNEEAGTIQAQMLIKQDTVAKTSLLLKANSLSLLDSLNYVLNGKKVSKDEFDKLDPNKIISVNIVTAETAKTMLNDYDSMNFKPHSKILFVTTGDSEKGKELADRLNGSRITGIRLNGQNLTYSNDFTSVYTDSMITAKAGRPAQVTNIRINGKNLDKLSPREIDSITVMRGGAVSRLNELTDKLAATNNLNALTYAYSMPANVTKKYNVRGYGKGSSKGGDVVEVRTLPGNLYYGDKSISRISDKLIIIDGKEATEKDLKKLSAFDIDRMSTASDADTVKKYGEKAKYGVVYIYTKKAK